MEGWQLVCAWMVLAVCVDYSLADCKWKEKGITVKEGEVVGFIPKKKFTPQKIKICEKSGKLKYIPETDAPGYNIGCNGCKWQGKVLCSGEMVEDLHSWWFESQCSGGG
eukprot:GFUD01079327.1.p1 GENE.GFUD01079327.1~~GFUD01079327.1.p1  ORF type:complete len:109 (-),score=22.99 GFUD01079327.1:59-385(-)